MSIKLMAQVWESSLPPTQKSILAIMANFAYDEDGDIFPSVATVSKLTSYSERTVRYTLKELVSDGFLTLTRVGGGIGYTNHYRINIEAVKGCTVCTVQEDIKGATDGIKGATDSLKGATDAPEPLLTVINLNIPTVTESVTVKDNYETYKQKVEERKQQTRASLIKVEERQHGEEDNRINDYPEDVRVIIAAVCELFNLKCPPKKSTHAGQWINESRELRDACGEFEKQVLVEIAKDFEQHMRLKGGTVPFPVSGPRSLVNTARAKAGELRTRKAQPDNIVPKGASMMYIGGKVFKAGVGEVPS